MTFFNAFVCIEKKMERPPVDALLWAVIVLFPTVSRADTNRTHAVQLSGSFFLLWENNFR